MNQIKAVVFDCDGVLFDTALANRKFYDEVLTSFGKPKLDDEQFRNVHMMTVKAAIEYLFPDMDDLSPVFKTLKQIGYHKFIPYMKMEEGLTELLKKLKANGLIRGIATNRTDTMEKVLENNELSPFFEIVVTAADVKNPKPDPEELNKILSAYGLNPDEMVFIGDSEFDQQAARRAGTFFIAFKQSGLEADAHVNSMDEVGSVLQINK